MIMINKSYKVNGYSVPKQLNNKEVKKWIIVILKN